MGRIIREGTTTHRLPVLADVTAVRSRIMQSSQGRGASGKIRNGSISKKAGNRRRKGEKVVVRSGRRKETEAQQHGVAKKEEAKGIVENERRKKEEKKRGGVSGRAHTGWRRRQCGSTGGEVFRGG